MGYCFMTTQKIKTLGALTSKFNHNYRKVEVSNADPELFHKNETLISTNSEDGTPLNYIDAWKQRLHGIDYYQSHDVRSNAVLAIEVVTTFSREENIDLESWKRENSKWLQKTFNVAGDGKNNVLDIIYHADEPGNVHCHAIVIPIDERNRLNASRFLNGQRALSELQTDYAKSMKQFGLERGLENGQARHQDIKKYYTELNRAMKVPMPEKNEEPLAYRDRILEDIQRAQAAAMREREEKRRENERKLAEKRITQEKYFSQERKKLQFEKENIIREVQNQNQELFQKLQSQKDAIQANEEKLGWIHSEIDTAQDSLYALQDELIKAGQVEKKVKFYDEFQKQYQLLRQKEPERAERFAQELKHMGTLQQERIAPTK